jgi:hypothetical protein
MSKAKKTKCYHCEAELDKVAIGLSKKLLGRNVTRFYCLSCLSNYLEVSVEDLLTKVEDFKSQGCILFN